MSDNSNSATTPFPLPVNGQFTSLTYTPPSSTDTDGTFLPQPLQQQIANFDAVPIESAVHGASTVAVSQQFVVYVVKKGLIRVLHRHSTLKALLRAHAGDWVSDVQFFQDGDVLATIGSNISSGSGTSGSSRVVVWRIFERASELLSEVLLEINAPGGPSSPTTVMSRVQWHPFNPNQFWILNAVSATLVETTRITTTLSQTTPAHSVVDWHSSTVLQDGGIVLSERRASSNNSNEMAKLVDVCWSGRDTRHVMAAYDTGEVVLWDLKQTQLVTVNGGTVAQPVALQSVQVSTGALSRCLFLPHTLTIESVGRPTKEPAWTSCFCTGSNHNSTLTLWSAFGPGATQRPVALQEITLGSLSSADATHPFPSFVLDLCFGPAPARTPHGSAPPPPPACFLTLASRRAGRLYALHLAAEWSATSLPVLRGCDYVVPLATQYPVYSCTATCVPAADVDDDDDDDDAATKVPPISFDMKLFCYQTQAVQCLTLTSRMCGPPAQAFDPASTVGVTKITTVAVVAPPAATIRHAISDVDEEEEAHNDDDDEYEAYDVDDEDEEEEEESSNGASDPSAGMESMKNNPFANWLGAIAGKTPTTPAAPPGPPGPPPGMMLPVSDTAPPTILSPPPRPHDVTPTPPHAAFLSPMDILSGASTNATHSNNQKQPSVSRQPTPTMANTSSSAATKNPAATEPTAVQRKPKEVPRAANDNGGGGGSGVVDNAAIVGEVRRVVQEELRTTVLPSIRQAVADPKHWTTALAPLQSAVSTLTKQGVTVDHDVLAQKMAVAIQEPLQHAFANCMRQVMIPTLESVTGQVLAQVSNHLEHNAAKGPSESVKLDSISKQLTTMTALVAELTKEVATLRTSGGTHHDTGVAGASSGLAAPTPIPRDAAEEQRGLIVSLLQLGKYEEAFTKAVSNTTVSMTLFCCQSADLQKVLGGAQSNLSQPILLCLMQQLGTVLVTSESVEHLQVALEWLQEIALSLNPADPVIKGHSGKVLHGVVQNIQARMQQRPDVPALRRPLQRMLQVVRGMQMD